MYIVKDNLTIRRAVAGDAELLCNWWNDGKVMAHAGFPKGLGTTAEEIIRKLDQDNDENQRLIIETEGRPIGEMCYRTIGMRTAEIGIKICDFSEQEKGYGTKFLRMLIEYLFRDMDYLLIKLDTNLNNNRAQHVYEKLGFIKTGIRTDAWRDQLGILQSAVDYELRRDDYPFGII